MSFRTVSSEVEVLKEQRQSASFLLVTSLPCLPGLHYRQCQLIAKEDVTHDTRLFCLKLPPSTHLQVPVGQHVYLKLSVTGKGAGCHWACGCSECGTASVLLTTWSSLPRVQRRCTWNRHGLLASPTNGAAASRESEAATRRWSG